MRYDAPDAVGTTTTNNFGRNRNVSIENAFGNGYTISAMAQMLTNTFDIKTFNPIEQPLEQQKVEWVWSMKPTSLGRQIINLNINFMWNPVRNEQIIQRTIWETQLPITVTPPSFLDLGQLSIGSLITALISGAGGLLVAFINGFIDRFFKRGEKTESVDEQKPKEEVKTDKKQNIVKDNSIH